MKFRTELNRYKTLEFIDYSKKILCIGSCFAEHLHGFLNYRKYNTFLNPCGITYNPRSIAKSIHYILGDSQLRKEDIQEYKGVYFHYDFHSKFSSTSLDGAFDNITNHLEKASHFACADVLIISLGTAFTYFLKDNGAAVNNCHKIAASEFTKDLLSVEDSVIVLQESIDFLQKKNPKLEVIITVSPVRHLRDGMVDNNLSKSVLLLASRQLENVTYFPSYELLLDDLRDYRYYDRDLVHPSEEAIEYILDFFNGQFLSTKEEELRRRIVQVRKEMEHRPFMEHSNQHQAFLVKLLGKINSLSDEYDIDMKKELSEVKARIQ